MAQRRSGVRVRKSPTTENLTSFFNRLVPLLAPSEVRTIRTAYTLSKYHHRFQTRKEKKTDGSAVRYFEHPRHVALILIQEVGCVEPEIVCAALLHDTHEDTRLDMEQLEQELGTKVARMVIRLSKKPKARYVERLRKYAGWEELLVKFCDHIHNRRTLASGSVTWQKKQIKETETKYLPLFDRLLEICPVQYRQAVQRLRDELLMIIAERKTALTGTSEAA